MPPAETAPPSAEPACAVNPDVRSVLVYSGGEIMGDGLNKLPFVRAVRRTFPNARITWFTADGGTVYAGKLAPAVRGWLDETVSVGKQRWSNVLRPRLGDRYFDVIIDTQRKAKASLELMRIPHGVFVSGTLNGLLSDRRAPGQPWRPAKPELLLDQLLQLLELARDGRVRGAADPSGAVEVSAAAAAAAERLLPEREAAMLAPGAGGAKKRWPLDRFLAVGETLLHVGVQPVVVLGPGESDWAPRVLEHLPDARLPLQEADAEALAHEPFLTMALAQRCRLALANDSGVGHILAASGVPLVTLFGPTNARKFRPYSPRLRLIRAADFGGGEMADIPLEAVESAVLEMLGARSRG